MHPPKRRKLDQPQLFNNKPFRSPLRTPANTQGNVVRSQTSTSDNAAKAQLSPSLSSKIPLSHSQESFDSASAAPLNSADVDVDALQKRQTALSIRLTQLHQSLECAEQALQIEASGQDAELKKLIIRWRAVAQEAADELFGDAKERVDSMGGVVAWRRQAEGDSQRWNDDLEKENMAHVDDSDAFRNDKNTEVNDALSNCEEEEEECSFTMEMMLHQMNVDLEAIGFDKQVERWVE
ncbi:hypothetical protein H2200_000082 [Cladophialophora chaetospira]|uniref:Swi5-dependent recombination DNA repair protein 1 n=1 Tax=Cladophialophora chaetospira TaxID=386627 RepID=A0AA38XNT8_9EURO|nr:hypothetical protein H2200_000082 [Cladophialophora chaetospira]